MFAAQAQWAAQLQVPHYNLCLQVLELRQVRKDAGRQGCQLVLVESPADIKHILSQPTGNVICKSNFTLSLTKSRVPSAPCKRRNAYARHFREQHINHLQCTL